MQKQYFKTYSYNLNRDMEFNVYGHGGKPCVVFPCQDGRFFDWEGNHMHDEVLGPWIEAGKLQLFCVDSIDMMYGRQDSYVLYFSIRPSKALARLQNDIHALMPGASYFPGTATSHMTICVDKDYTKICAIKERLDARFRPFRMRISALELYELYPPVLLTKVD